MRDAKLSLSRASAVYMRIMTPVIAVSALLTQPAVAKPPEPMQPSSPWNIDWADKACILRRAFGEGDKQVILQFEKFQPYGSMRLLLVGKPFWTVTGPLVIQYGESAPGISLLFLKGQNTQKVPVIASRASGLVAVPDKGRIAQVGEQPLDASIQDITLEWPRHSIKLATGPLRHAVSSLQACTNDLVKGWGLDPNEQEALSKRPKPVGDAKNWVGPKDFPAKGSARGTQGTVTFRLNVDANGTAAACDLLQSYADAELKSATCTILMRRARFEPALDASGKPAPSYYVSSVTWLIGN